MKSLLSLRASSLKMLPQKLLALSGVFLTLGLAPHPASAGTWRFTITGSGTATASNSGGSSNSNTWVAPSPANNSISLPSFSAGIGQGGTGTSNLNVTITVEGTWQSDRSIPGGDPAPPFVKIEEIGSVSYGASSTVPPGQTPSASGDAKNGLGDPVVKTVSTNPLPPFRSETGVSASSSINRHFTNFNGTISFSRTFTASANASGGGGTSVTLNGYTVRIHAQPYDYRINTAAVNTDGTLVFTYKWLSTSGSISHLGHCYSHERVTYPGGNPFIPPAPFVYVTVPNPTVLPGTGTAGIRMNSILTNEDKHHVYASAAPYSIATFSAAQRYEYDDTITGETNVLIPGPDSTATITRTITNMRVPFSQSIWWYTITKQGYTAWLQLTN